MRMEAREAARARPGPAFKGFGTESKVRNGAFPGFFSSWNYSGKAIWGIFGVIVPSQGVPGTIPAVVSQPEDSKSQILKLGVWVFPIFDVGIFPGIYRE